MRLVRRAVTFGESFIRNSFVMPLSVPDDEAVVLMEVKPHSIPIDNDEAPIV